MCNRIHSFNKKKEKQTQKAKETKEEKITSVENLTGNDTMILFADFLCVLLTYLINW